MAKPKIVKGRGHVTAESSDRASASLPTTKAEVATKKATSSASGALPAPSKPSSSGTSKARPKAVSGASRSIEGKVKPKPTSTGPSTRGGKRRKASSVSGASRSTKGKVKAVPPVSARTRAQVNDFRQKENKRSSDDRRSHRGK